MAAPVPQLPSSGHRRWCQAARGPRPCSLQRSADDQTILPCAGRKPVAVCGARRAPVAGRAPRTHGAENCAGVRRIPPSAIFGQANVSPASRSCAGTSPVWPQTRTLILSARLERKTNIAPRNGSSRASTRPAWRACADGGPAGASCPVQPGDVGDDPRPHLVRPAPMSRGPGEDLGPSGEALPRDGPMDGPLVVSLHKTPPPDRGVSVPDRRRRRREGIG